MSTHDSIRLQRAEDVRLLGLRSDQSPEEALWAYLRAGLPVIMENDQPHLVLGDMPGLTGYDYAAISGPAQAITNIPDLRDSVRIQRDHGEQVVLLAHAGAPLTRTTYTKALWVGGEENGSGRERTVVQFTVHGEHDRITLPYAGSDLFWQPGPEGRLMGLPFAMANAAVRVPVNVTDLGDVSAEEDDAPDLLRTGELTMVYGNAEEDVGLVLMGLAARSVISGDRVLYLDYRGIGKRRFVTWMKRLGVCDFTRLAYVERPASWSDRLDLGSVADDKELAVVDDLPGALRVDGRIARSAEHVLPILSRAGGLARDLGLVVVIGDRGAGPRPVGAREKLDAVDGAWRVQKVVDLANGNGGLLRLEGVKNTSDRLVAIRGDDPLVMDFDAGEEVMVAAEQEKRERVKTALVGAVRLRPRRLTKHQLTTLPNMAGARALRRELVEELEVEGVLVVVSERRSERGTARTRVVYEVANQ